MRIIRIVVILLALLMASVPFIASAAETTNTDINTKTDFFKMISMAFLPPVQAAEQTLPVADITEKTPEKTAEELQKDAILAKWQTKQAEKWANLPKGEFVINASAYTAAADECGGNTSGKTASGVIVKAQRTIACPPEFPFGAKLKIADLGTFVCEDRGGAIKGNHVDIYMETKKEAFQFGRQNLVAQIVE